MTASAACTSGGKFQCSSASRKFLNSDTYSESLCAVLRFSALQRAENSSIPLDRHAARALLRRFSALQRAENSSICVRCPTRPVDDKVSVLFSEPKIPQFVERRRAETPRRKVSVLFSEPKIPQFSS